MSKFRRPFLYDRYIFVTVNLLRSRRKLEEPDFARLAIALAQVAHTLPLCMRPTDTGNLSVSASYPWPVLAY